MQTILEGLDVIAGIDGARACASVNGILRGPAKEIELLGVGERQKAIIVLQEHESFSRDGSGHLASLGGSRIRNLRLPCSIRVHGQIQQRGHGPCQYHADHSNQSHQGHSYGIGPDQFADRNGPKMCERRNNNGGNDDEREDHQIPFDGIYDSHHVRPCYLEHA